MSNLKKLINLVQNTRSQVQQGYILSGVKLSDISNLAEHHYLVAFIAWQLTQRAVSEGAKIDMGRVLELALMHDLGELFGGDIAMPYAQMNPQARIEAKNFERENLKYLSNLFDNREYFNVLSTEVIGADSDEGHIMKIADLLEISHFKAYIGIFGLKDIDLIKEKLDEHINNLKDKVAKKIIGDCIKEWIESMKTNPKESIFS